MASPVSITRKTKAAVDTICYAGPLSEDAGVQLLSLYGTAAKSCVFNLAAMTRTNSKGIGVWMDFMRSFREGRSVRFEECAPCFVELMNMVPSVRSGIAIDSVLVPFACSCGQSTLKLAAFSERNRSLAALVKPPSCAKCHVAMAIEEEPAIYFEFAITAGLVENDVDGDG